MDLDSIFFYIKQYFTTIVDIFIVAYILYTLYKVIARTRSIQTLKGLGIILLAYLIGKFLELNTFVWLFERGLEVAAIALIIIFQNELRRIIMKLGENTAVGNIFRRSEPEISQILQIIPPLVYKFSEKRIGALIVFTKKTGLQGIVEKGIEIDSILSTEVLEAIFNPSSPIHDGAVIVSTDRITAAGCLLPLTERTDLQKLFGTRHKAAIGLSEETDSVIVVVSEENGNVSIAHEAMLYYGLKPQKFKVSLKNFLSTQIVDDELKNKKNKFFHRIKNRIKNRISKINNKPSKKEGEKS